MKIDYGPEDEISILENKERSEYYHKSKEMYKQMEEYFLMSVLKCDRSVTQLSPLDKTIVLINKINTILFPHFDKLVLDEELNNIENIDLLSVKEMFSNDFKINTFKQDLVFYREQIDKYMRNLRKTIQKALRYQYTKSYEGKMRRYNIYIAVLDIIDNFIATLNEMSNKFKNIIWSLTPYVIFIENIKEDIIRDKQKCKKQIDKMQKLTGIILEKRDIDKIVKILTRDKIELNSNDITRLLSLIPNGTRKKIINRSNKIKINIKR